MELFTDRTTAGIEQALDGVALRQRVSANNIANVNTPGFQAGRVNFEEALSDAYAGRSRVQQSDPEITAADTPMRLDGNNVALEDESMIMIRSGLQYEALTNALTFKLRLLGAAVRS